MVDAGASVPKWGGRRATAALDRVKSLGRRNKTPCCLCGRKIDYDLPSTHPDGCTVQHIQSRHRFPHLTWAPSNWAPAHRSCNSSAGDQSREPGVTSTQW